VCVCPRSVHRQALRQVCETFFEFAAENRGYAKRAKIVNIHGGVQAVTTEMRAWILFPKLRNELRGQPRGRMHGQINRD